MHRNPSKFEIAAALSITIGAIAAATPAYSQSFNCAKATRTTEFAICNNETLIELDETMASFHQAQLQKLNTKPQKQSFSKLSKKWLKQRNACKGDFACLEMRYKERINVLTNS